MDILTGTHVADRASITFKEAGKQWLARVEAEGIERGTLLFYRQHVDLHIVPLIGKDKLSQFTVPKAHEFLDTLRANGRSEAMVRKVRVTLGTLIADAQVRGKIGHNPIRELRRNPKRRRGKDKGHHSRKLQIGVDIPTPDEIRQIVAALPASGRWRPLFLTTIFCGLRASELRGLRWADVDLKNPKLQVRQRADRYNEIGATKSEAGERTLPLYPMAANALREWKLKCPKGKMGLVFPNGAGKVENLKNIINRGLHPVMVKAGVTVPVLDAKGEPVRDEKGKPLARAKYTGMHALRHFYASWCINAKEDGGLGLLPKRVQERMGHSSIVITMDTYGHLFPRGGDTAASLAEDERGLILASAS